MNVIHQNIQYLQTITNTAYGWTLNNQK